MDYRSTATSPSRFETVSRQSVAGKLTSAMLWGALLGSIAPVALLSVDVAQAQSASDQLVEFSIQSQPLGAAVTQFSRMTGWQVGYAGALATSVTTNAVSGQMSPFEALQEMLLGTGIVVRPTGAKSVALIGESLQGAVDADTQLLPPVIVGSNGLGPNSKYEEAGSVEYISSEQIERFRGTSAGDFLKGTNGVLVGESRNGGAVDVNIRGMQGQGRVPVIIDGAYQESTSYRGYYGITGKTFLDPDMIGSVEVEKGPSASADGVGATGGVVRMTTLNPDDIIEDGKSYGVRLKAGVVGNSTRPPTFPTTYEDDYFRIDKSAVTLGASNGSADQFDRPGLLEFFTGDDFAGSASVAGAYKFGELEFLAAFARRSVGNYYAGSNGDGPAEDREYGLGQEVLNSSNDSKSYLFKTNYSFGDGHSVNFGYSRYESEYGEIMPSTMTTGTFSLGTMQFPLSNTKVDTVTARYRWEPEELDWVNLKADVFYTNLYQDITTAYSMNAGGDMIILAPTPYISRTEQMGVNVSNTSRFATQLGALELEYGGMYRKEITFPAPEYAERLASGEVVSDSAWEPRNGWREEFSGFAAAEYKPIDDLTLLGSLRYTYSKSFDNDLGYGKTEHNSEDNAGWAPIVSAKYEILPGLQLYGKYAEAIRMPSLFEATSGWGADNSALTDLKPEHSKTYEAGVNFQTSDFLSQGDHLGMKFSYFDSNVDNYITRDTSGAVLVNIDKVALKGVEWSVGYDSQYFFANTSATKYLNSKYCDQEGTCTSTGTKGGYSQLHLPPEFSASATVGVKLLDEKLQFGGRMIHVGYRAATKTNIIGAGVVATVNWEPYTTFDLFGSYDLNDNFRIDFAVDNVTDRYYMDAMSISPIAAPGRTAHLTLTAKF